MSKDTFEGWCTPASIGDHDLGTYADHTFVYCTNKDKSFKCWGSADRSRVDAARVCSHEGSSAYCRANNYRVSVGDFEDTAGVGIYAINGVCHQSANLFLYSAGTLLPLNQKRPKGILASHALYGVYGAPHPGGIAESPAYFAAWNAAFYAQASVRCWSLLSEPPGIQAGSSQELVSKITQLHLERSGVRATSSSSEKVTLSLVPQEMELLLAHYLPGVDNTIIRTVHDEIMVRKEEIFALHGLVMSADMTTEKALPQGSDVDRMVNKLNELALEFQSHLAEQLGVSDFVKINGDEHYYSPIDPTIARQAFASMVSK